MKNIKKNFIMAVLTATLSSGAFASVTTVNGQIQLDVSSLSADASREEVLRVMQHQAQQQQSSVLLAQELTYMAQIRELRNQLANAGNGSVQQITILTAERDSLSAKLGLEPVRTQDAVTAAVAPLQARVRELELAAAHIQEVANNTAGILDLTTTSLANAEEKIIVLERKLATETANHTSLQTSAGQSAATIANLQNQVSQLSGSLGKAQATIANLQSQITQFSVSLHAEKETIKGLNVTIDRLKAALNT